MSVEDDNHHNIPSEISRLLIFKTHEKQFHLIQKGPPVKVPHRSSTGFNLAPLDEMNLGQVGDLRIGPFD